MYSMEAPQSWPSPLFIGALFNSWFKQHFHTQCSIVSTTVCHSLLEVEAPTASLLQSPKSLAGASPLLPWDGSLGPPMTPSKTKSSLVLLCRWKSRQTERTRTWPPFPQPTGNTGGRTAHHSMDLSTGRYSISQTYAHRAYPCKL